MICRTPAIQTGVSTLEPLLRNVPTYICARRDDLAYVLDHLPELVVKAVNESGGYGMLMGPFATAEQCREFRAKILRFIGGRHAMEDDSILGFRYVSIRP